MTKYSIQHNKGFVSQSSSAEPLEATTKKAETQTQPVKLGTLCNHIFRNMENMRYNEAVKFETAKTSHVLGQNPWPDMQVLPIRANISQLSN